MTVYPSYSEKNVVPLYDYTKSNQRPSPKRLESACAPEIGGLTAGGQNPKDNIVGSVIRNVHAPTGAAYVVAVVEVDVEERAAALVYDRQQLDNHGDPNRRRASGPL
jgi:hypothetical protein